jgi:hypothetical protein
VGLAVAVPDWVNEGEIIAASQAYDTRASAEKGIESVNANAPGAKVVDLTEREPAHNCPRRCQPPHATNTPRVREQQSAIGSIPVSRTSITAGHQGTFLQRYRIGQHKTSTTGASPGTLTATHSHEQHPAGVGFWYRCVHRVDHGLST